MLTLGFQSVESQNSEPSLMLCQVSDFSLCLEPFTGTSKRGDSVDRKNTGNHIEFYFIRRTTMADYYCLWGERKYGGRVRSKGLRVFAVVMEGVTVGQVFDAECILSKRPRKVRAGVWRLHGPCVRSGRSCRVWLTVFVSSAGKIWVSGQVERLVVQVSS